MIILRSQKMPNALFNADGGINNITGFVNEHEGDIKAKLLKNIINKSIGIWNSATPENPTTVAAAGTYVFKVISMVQYGAYTKANRENPGDLKKVELQTTADVVGQEVARTEIEQLDQAITADAAAFSSYLARSHSTSLTALLDAHYIDLAVKTAAKTPGTSEVINADFADLKTETLRTDAYRQVARAKVAVTRQINKYNIGSNPEDYATLLHLDVQNDLLLAMPKGGNSATDIGQKLATNLQASIIAGLGLTKDHTYLGQDILAGTSFSKDSDFLFNEVYGVIAHGEALFIALNGLTVRATVNPNSGNDILISKFNYYKEAIRPELLRVLRTKASGAAPAPKAPKAPKAPTK